jgi:hypothetical protein
LWKYRIEASLLNRNYKACAVNVFQACAGFSLYFFQGLCGTFPHTIIMPDDNT